MGKHGGTSLTLGFTDFRTHLFFPGADGGRLTQRQVSLSGAHPLGASTLSWFAGAPVSGTFSLGAARHDLGLGGALGVGLTWPLWTTYDRPFAVDLSAQLGSAWTGLAGAAGELVAIDVRLGATASRTFARNLTVWSAARVFGGPLFATLKDGSGGATSEVGSDTRHVQLAAGLSGAPFGRHLPGLRLSLEGRAVSEWGFSASLSWHGL